MKVSLTDKLNAAKIEQQAEAQVYTPVNLSHHQLEALFAERPEVTAVDAYDELLEELFRIENPAMTPLKPDYYQKLADFQAEHYGSASPLSCGQWIYYPWRHTVVHDLAPDLHDKVRSARNRNLISETEQDKLRQASVGVAGLSVGSNVVAALTLTSRYKLLKIADADTLALSNLNRLRGGLSDIGTPKTTLAARGIYDLDPHAAVEVFPEGLTDDTMQQFLDGLDVVVDEIDDISMKVKLRLAARERRLPVVMVTDATNGCILDIERYDLDPGTKIFHGRLSEAEISSLLRPNPDRSGWIKLAAKVIGVEHLQPRLLQSVPEIGRTIASVPQLGTATMIAGSVASYTVRMIVLGEAINAGKLTYPIEAVVLKDYEKVKAETSSLLRRMAAGRAPDG